MDGIEPSPYHCTPYVEDADPDNFIPCRCPVCGGFLKWDETGEIPICNNCGAELAKVPNQKPKEGEEETEEDNDLDDLGYRDGKICVLSGPKWSKEERREKRKQRREQKNLLKKQRLERRKERAQKELEAAQKKIEALK
jgi:DNA-directed RNA polymerase subunit N (RpoN/RPB10)